MKKERNMYLDVLKGINIILVIVGHCIQYGNGEVYGWGAFFENPAFIFIYSFHMPLFMLISGYFFAFSVKTKKWTKLIVTKFRQLVVPLFGWSILSLIITLIKPETRPVTVELTWVWNSLVKGFISAPWFLWAVWFCSIIIIIVRKLFKDNTLVYILLSLVTFIIPEEKNLALLNFMWPFFLMGYFFNAKDYTVKLKKIYLNKIFIISIFVIFAYLLPLYNYDTYIYTSGYSLIGRDASVQLYNDFLRFAIGLVGSVAIMYIVYPIVKILPDRINRMIAYIGKNTLGLYIVSSVINVEILAKVTAGFTELNYFYVIIESVIILCASLIINGLLKRFTFTNRLFLGGR